MSVVVTQTQPVQVVTSNPRPGPTVVIQNAPYQPPPFNYATQQSLTLGVIQIICGVLSIIFNTVLIIYSKDYYDAGDSGYGIWCGVFFLVSGGLGVGASQKPQYGLVVAHMVMSIFSAVFAGILLIASSVGAATSDDCNYYNYIYSYICDKPVVKGLNIGMVIVALLEAVLAIWASVICCSACCCRQPAQSGNVIMPGTIQYTTTTVGGAGQVMYQQQYPQQFTHQPPPYQTQAYQQTSNPQYNQQMGTAPPPPPAYAAPVTK